MRQKIEVRQCLHSVCGLGSFAETSAIELHRRLPKEVPGLRMAFSPASQGHSAAVEQVPTAATFSSVVCNGVRATAWPLAAPRQDNPRGADVRKRQHSDKDRLWFSRRSRGTRFSTVFSFCPASQGKVAVAEPVPAAATSCVSSDRIGRADVVDTVPRRGAR